MGTDEFVRDATLRRVRELEPVVEQIRKLSDLHVAFTLLRSCLSVSKVLYLLRTTPPHLNLPAIIYYDKMVQDTLRVFTGGTLPVSIVPQLTLPVSTYQPSFGLGLTSAADIAAPAYLASRAVSLPVLKQ